MNKKFLTFGLMGLFLIGLVAAAIITQYGSIEQSINIESPITVTGDIPELATGYSGSTFEGEEITVTNAAPFKVSATISNDAPEGISVEYISTATLSKKVVDFDNAPWAQTGDAIEVEYTVVGDSFSAEVTSPIEGYELVYYKDNSDRFNDPANAISVDSITENLPYESDGNADEYDMCVIEGYFNCNGAKIWYVPSNAVTDGVIDWSKASEFYFDTELIQYNEQGEVNVFSDLTITPVYTIGEDYVGEDTITTTVA